MFFMHIYLLYINIYIYIYKYIYIYILIIMTYNIITKSYILFLSSALVPKLSMPTHKTIDLTQK